MLSESELYFEIEPVDTRVIYVMLYCHIGCHDIHNNNILGIGAVAFKDPEKFKSIEVVSTFDVKIGPGTGREEYVTQQFLDFINLLETKENVLKFIAITCRDFMWLHVYISKFINTTKGKVFQERYTDCECLETMILVFKKLYALTEKHLGSLSLTMHVECCKDNALICAKKYCDLVHQLQPNH